MQRSGMSFDDAFHSFPHLESERLVLRAATADDAHDLLRMAESLINARFGGPHLIPNHDARAYIEDRGRQYERRERIEWGIVLKTDSTLIGGVSLTDFLEKGRAELGYYLSRDHWGKGLTTEAVRAVLRYGFEEMGLYRIHATAHPENVGSIRVLEKVGMRREGLMRGYSDTPDPETGIVAWTDAVMFAMLRGELPPPFGSAQDRL